MNDPQYNLIERVSEIDPLHSESEPAKGSSRYQAILEAAMQSGQEAAHDVRGTQPNNRPRWKRRLVIAAGAVGIAAAVSLGVVIPKVVQPVAYADVIRTAAVRLGEADTVRGTMTWEYSRSFESGGVMGHRMNGDFAINGADSQRTETFYSYGFEGFDGTEGSEITTIVIGNQEWWRSSWSGIGEGPWNGEGEWLLSTTEDSHEVPFTEASQALLEAALTDTSIVLVGTEDVRGVSAAHYHLDQSDGWSQNIKGLTMGVKTWFDHQFDDGPPLRATDSATVTLDVWVAEGLIVRLAIDNIRSYSPPLLYDMGSVDGWERPDEFMHSEQSSNVADFFDYGADIRIEPPAGPFREPLLIDPTSGYLIVPDAE